MSASAFPAGAAPKAPGRHSSRYVVVGAGAVGATLAAELHQAGRAVVLVARGAHLAALVRCGLRYLRPDGEHVVEVPVVAGPDEVELRADDVLVLATKAQDADAALASWAWRPVKRGDGATAAAAGVLPVLVLQNGLDSERAALRRFATVWGAAIWSPASYVSPGEVISPADPAVGVIWVGPYPGGPALDGVAADNRLAGVADDLRAARHLVEVVADTERIKAGKLLTILPNAVDALYRPGVLRDRAAAALVAEARRVYTRAGVDPADLAAETALDLTRFRKLPVPDRPETGRSTWQSLARGVPPESDFLNGEIVLLARLHGGTAPRNAAAQARVQRAAAEGTAPGSLGDDDLRAVLPGLDVLVDATALAADPAVTLLDVRWALGDPHGRERHRESHVPGAVYVDLDTELAGAPSPAEGRHPLPGVADLQAAARRWGVRGDRPVVVYDAGGGLAAARAWWLLRWAGHPDVRILDGGLAAWTAAGLPVESGEVVAQPGDIVLEPGHLPVLDIGGAAELAAALPGSGVLLDARAGERYRGEVEPVDPRAGHVPGAASAPTGDNLSPDGRFHDPDALRRRFADLGADGSAPVGVYCGSGVTAAHEIAALAVAGVSAALYPGSWSQWSADPGRPAATGPDPR
jgi:thiosulfate/3-mercaptopyruvate sulfurtransferase